MNDELDPSILDNATDVLMADFADLVNEAAYLVVIPHGDQLGFTVQVRPAVNSFTHAVRASAETFTEALSMVHGRLVDSIDTYDEEFAEVDDDD